MGLKPIQTDDAPAAVGPYSQGMKAGNFVYVSGQLPINPELKKMVSGDIQMATKQSLDNCKAILKSAGLTFEDVVKVEVFLRDMNDFAKVNEVMQNTFLLTNQQEQL